MAEITVPWGAETLTVPLPEHWTLGQTLSPELRSAPPDWTDRLAVALTRPEGMPALSELLAPLASGGGRIALIVEDVTRHSPLTEILPVIVREFDHAGIKDEQVEVVFGTGMHPDMTPEQARGKIGPLAERYAWRNNECRNAKGFAKLGRLGIPGGRGELDVFVDQRVAQADLRIVVTSISPHLLAGFGGGAKMLVPGCASLETIAQLHIAGLPRESRQLVGTDVSNNPMRQMINQAGRMIDANAGRTFAVQYLLDDKDKPSAVVAGDLEQGQEMLAKQCAVSSGLLVESPADILITNAAPRDFDLWQSFKCIPNTRWAVRENGVIIVLARCEGGMNMPAPKWCPSPRTVRGIIRFLGVSGIVSMVNRWLPGVNHEAKFFVQLATETIYRNPILVYSPNLVKSGSRFPGLPVYDDFQAIFKKVDEHLGEGSRRVTVFTAGGASYPIQR